MIHTAFLFDAVQAHYTELLQLAKAKLAREPSGTALQPCDLVHETWLRLQNCGPWHGQGHFLGQAAKTMRRILIDHARQRWTLRRGAGAMHTELSDHELSAPMPDDHIAAIGEAFSALANADPQLAKLVSLRYFKGFTVVQVACAIGISPPTVKRRWQVARAWLAQHLEHGEQVAA